MRVRTFVGILLALTVVVSVSYLTHQNVDLLKEPFALTAARSVPLWTAVLGVFLLGFLPVVTVLIVETLRRDLAERRDRRLSREAQSLKGTFRRGIDLQVDGQWARAAAEFKMVLAEQPEDFETLMRYGEVLRHLGHADEALEVHRRASVLYPHSVGLLYELAEDYDVTGDREVARQIRDRILRDFSGLGLLVMRRRRNAALAARDWKSATRLQEKIETLLTESGAVEPANDVGIRRGLAYQEALDHLENERLEAARDILRQLLEQEPCFLPAGIMLGEVALLRGDEEGALGEWRRGFETTGSPVFLQRIEDHFIEREEPLRAIETLHQLIAGAKNDLLPRFFLGRLYYRLEMHDEALKALAPLADRIKGSPTYHLLLARIHQRRGEMRRAVESYLACVTEAGITAAEYQCRICRARHGAWQDRCDGCGSWNSVELEFDEEKVSPEELGLQKRPIWAIYGEGEDFAPAGE